ncbi:MAG TPA: hypothetical protein VF032_01750 [Thermoleophilaceae bacterium]
MAAAVALASLSPAAFADSTGGHGNGKGHAHSHSPASSHAVTYVFKGTWNAADGTVTVNHGNAHVRHAGLLGQNVTFDLTGAKLVVADTNGDGSRTIADLKDGDRVLVKARLPRKDPGTQPFKAKMLIDQSARPAPGGAD